MKLRILPPTTSLRTKLILSFLGIALAAILVLIITVAIAIQQYFINVQMDDLTSEVKSRLAPALEDFYQYQGGGSLSGLASQRIMNNPGLVAVVDKKGTLIVCWPSTREFQAGSPAYIYGACNDPTITQALSQALQGHQPQGQYQASVQQWQGSDHADQNTPSDLYGQHGPIPHSLSSIYISIPLQVNNQTVGALFVAVPTPPLLPNSLQYGLISQVNRTILIIGLALVLVVLLFSFFLARQLTRPLKSLTKTAEKMKEGNYTERVIPPETQDEIGLLALTFNEMASRIEADVNELRQQDQVRRDLIANIAHDLVTPLTAIQGFSEALADNVISDPEERQETALRIGREVQRLRRLVADVRQMTSIESGQIHLDLAPLNIRELVNETIDVIAAECEQMGIRVANPIPPYIPQVLADSDRITQVLLNLLDNARRHTPKGGRISVGAQPQGGYLYVWVSDTGTGIAPEELPHIFERFYRADRSRTSSTGGSGLGLAIVKAMITAHSGNIWAESKLGQGTRIIFTLPIATAADMNNPPDPNTDSTSALMPDTNRSIASQMSVRARS